MFIKKFSLLLVIMLLMFNIHSASASQRFVDVPSSNDAYKEINYLIDLGAIKGFTIKGATYYKPNSPVTRGQAAKIVMVSTKNSPLTVSKSSFSDVIVGTELSGYVERAVKLGYFEEYTNGKFAPNVGLTREEMSKILTNAYHLNADQYANSPIPYTDVTKKHPYYKYIAAIYYNGIAMTSTKFNPKDPVKRSQFASFTARAADGRFRLDLPVQGISVPDNEETIGTVKVTTDNLNVRSTADSSTASNILGKVDTGTTFPVFQRQSNGWLKVAYGGSYAYVYDDYAQFLDQYGQPVGSVKKNVIANNNKVIFYKTRDINGKELGSFNKGETIKVYKTAGNWYLTVQNGVPGYVRVAQTIDNSVPVVEKPIQEPSKNGLTTNTIGSATVNNLHIRAAASSSSTSLGTINRGTLVEVHSITGNWVKVSYKGINGYTHKTFLRLINQTGSPVKNRIIVIDAGHGGKDPGATSNGAAEKRITLNVATKVKEKLEAAGAKVYMTRTGDTYPTLSDRVNYATNHYAEIFVSIHVNSATSTTAKGTETYYSISANDNEKEDFALASAINNQIVNNADMVNRGVRREDYFVLRNMILPSVLVELGFISNSQDREKLINDQYVNIFANSIYKGIVQYYSK